MTLSSSSRTGPGSGQSGRWAHVYLSMAKAKAGVAHWAAKAGHANLHWQDNTYTQTATGDSGELLYTGYSQDKLETRSWRCSPCSAGVQVIEPSDRPRSRHALQRRLVL